jgi:hypothetical protein
MIAQSSPQPQRFDREVDRRRALDVAGRAAREYARRDQGTVAAFVAGSMASSTPPPYADVDLRILLDAHEPPPGTFFALRDGVPLECKFLPAARYASTEEVLEHPFRAAEIAEAVILYDPRAFVHDLRRAMLPAHRTGKHRPMRAARLMDAATERFQRAEALWRETGSLALWEHRCALFWAGEALLVLHGERPTHRRLVVALRDIVGGTTEEHVADGLLHALGAAHWSPDDVHELLGVLFGVLAALPAESARFHPYLARERRPLWEHSLRLMASEGCHRETAMPVWSLLVLLWAASAGVPEQRAACGRLLERMGWTRPHGVEARLDAARAWMAELEPVARARDAGAGSRADGDLRDACTDDYE